MAKRIEALDSLRGLASLSVVIHHTLISFPIFYAPYIGESVTGHTASSWVRMGMRLLSYSPLHIVWGGHEAVILFFVLSGFVLALPYLSGDAPPYLEYLLKRVCRIYVPYIFSVAVSILLFISFGHHRIPQLSDWFNGMWAEPTNRTMLLDYILMTGRAAHNVNTVIWSLVYEMRISLVFPVLMRVIMPRGWKFSLAVAGALFAGAVALMHTVTFTGSGNLWSTLYYAAFFVVGATLAKHRSEAGAIMLALSGSQRTLAYCGMALLLSWRWVFNGVPVLGELTFAEGAIGLGAVLCILAALNFRSWVSALSRHWIVRLGKISYSLYLVHIVVLLTLVHSLHTWLPLPVVLLLVPVVSIPIAAMCYALVEHPSITLGRALARRFRFPRAPKHRQSTVSE